MSNELGRSNDENAAPYSFGENWQISDLELKRRLARKKRNQRNIFIAVLSSVLVLGSLLITVITSPGFKVFSETFFKWAYGVEVLPKIILGFSTNIFLTIIAATCVSIIGLSIAIIRTSRAASLTPIRILATIYVDLFRGIPMLLVILLVGFGLPALQIKGFTNNVLILGTLAVIITYSAYVA